MTQSFEGLEVYQEARKLRRRVYKLIARLPDTERFNLTSQMRRASLSVTNNIAEGHGSRSWKHNISYLYRTRGSLNELIDDLNTCEDEGYFAPEHLLDLRNDALAVTRLVNGYIAYLRRQMQTHSGSPD